MSSTSEKMRWVMSFGACLMVTGILLGACGRTSASTANTSAQTGIAIATKINVVTNEMSITFETMPTQAGKFTFVVTNRGSINHNFVIQGRGVNVETKMIPPQSSDSITVDLGPGNYTFVCSAPGHALVGMRGSFTLG